MVHETTSQVHLPYYKSVMFGSPKCGRNWDHSCCGVADRHREAFVEEIGSDAGDCVAVAEVLLATGATGLATTASGGG
jgi:hypothetical protein